MGGINMRRIKFMAGSSALTIMALSRVPAQAATDEFVKYDGDICCGQSGHQPNSKYEFQGLADW